jgi:hypothetical protein
LAEAPPAVLAGDAAGRPNLDVSRPPISTSASPNLDVGRP